MNKLKALYWKFFNKEKYNTYLILCWIKDAKKFYLKWIKNEPGMCFCFACTKRKHSRVNFAYADEVIPEFNWAFLGGSNSTYWWPRNNTQARIDAFNKLIKIYEEKCAQ